MNNDVSKILSNVTLPTAKPLPIILLLDTSSSMTENGKIVQLNNAVREMIDSFRDSETLLAKISVCIITFGGSFAQIHQNLTDADEIVWSDMTAEGMTPMGDAVRLAKEIVEDRSKLNNTYRPTIILVSDGMPNDDGWDQQIERFATEGRSSKCVRMAMGIGAPSGTDAYEVLKKFAGDPEMVFTADAASDIKKFFRYISSTTSQLTHSNNIEEARKSFPKPCEIASVISDDDNFEIGNMI